MHRLPELAVQWQTMSQTRRHPDSQRTDEASAILAHIEARLASVQVTNIRDAVLALELALRIGQEGPDLAVWVDGPPKDLVCSVVGFLAGLVGPEGDWGALEGSDHITGLGASRSA